MSIKDPPRKKVGSRFNQWTINLLIIIIAIGLVLIFGEMLIRWVDGYNLLDLSLNQVSTTDQQTK